jgi:HK97 family phage prohead protease
MEYEVRSSELWEECRFVIEDGEGSGLTMTGPMAPYEKPSNLLSEMDLPSNQRGKLASFGSRTFREIIHRGAFTKTLAEAPDIVLHYQHDERTLPLGRTKAGTLTLVDEGDAVRTRAELPDNEWGRPVRDAVKRGDIGGISFRMGRVVESWKRERLADGYEGPVRHLHEIQLRREVSLVTFPGYITPATVREMAEAADLEPDELAKAFAVLRDPEAKLSDAQHHLLQSAIATKVDAPFLDPKLAQWRERIGPAPVAIAG